MLLFEVLLKSRNESCGQKKIKLSKAVSVAGVYLDVWESADGTVHFAPDTYDLDGSAAQLESRTQ